MLFEENRVDLEKVKMKKYEIFSQTCHEFLLHYRGFVLCLEEKLGSKKKVIELHPWAFEIK